MKRKRLISYVLPSYLIIIFLALFATIWLANHTLKQFYLAQTTEDLLIRAELFKSLFTDCFTAGEYSKSDSLCKVLGESSQTRITIISAEGRIIGDTEEDPHVMENHADRPEFRDAREHGQGISIRYSPTLKKQMIYVALPVFRQDKKFLGVIRASVGLTATKEVLLQAYSRIAISGLIIILLVSIASYVLSKRISKPLEQIKQDAERFANGKLDRRLTSFKIQEFADLARALNKTAVQLQDRIRIITHQRNELEAVLGSMVEGVLALDMEERIIKANRSAAAMLDFKFEDYQNRSLSETVRNPDLQRFINEVLKERKNKQGKVVVDAGELFLQIEGTLIHDSFQKQIGALFILHDVTRVHNLENVRRDFAASVSHELRTPITAIKGFVETLQDGAIDDPDAARKFLDIICRHIDRLNMIIEELLNLAKIERQTETGQVELREENLNEILTSATRNVELITGKKGIKVELSCPKEIKAQINRSLLEQAIVNMLDNAFNHSPEGSTVQLGVEETEESYNVYVEDHGSGMEAKHLPRIFERFYRIDPERSRKNGGTGLGLAIVKHIALAHSGTVSAESQPGVGSRFVIHLPKQRKVNKV